MNTATLVPHPRHPDLAVDLSFHPVENSSPRALTARQISEFNENGHLLGVPIFTRDEARRLFQFCEGPLTVRIHEDLAARRGAISYHCFVPEVYDMACHPRVLGILRDLIGPNIICQVSEYVCKRPGDGWPSTFHQDASFNPLSRAGSIIVWIALDDADEGNGCMRFYAGSHKRGAIPCEGNEAEKRFGIDNPEQYGRRVNAEVKAGYAAIFSDLLVHGAPPNPSPTRLRPAYTFSYCHAEVVPYKDWDRHSILCCGEDKSLHWRVSPRPRA